MKKRAKRKRENNKPKEKPQKRQKLQRGCKQSPIPHVEEAKKRGNLRAMRMNGASTTPGGTKVKVAHLIDGALFSESTRKVLQWTHNEECSQLPLYRPVAEIIYDDKSSPVEVQTAGKTKLSRLEKGHKGCFYTYSNIYSPAKVIKKNLLDEFNVEGEDEIRPKKQKVKITKDLIEKSKKENQKLARRIPSQRDVMGMGANEYGSAIFENTDKLFFEWLHSVAHSIIGNKKAQAEENLFLGSKDCNTQIMLLEACFPILAALCPDGFELEVEPILIDKTHAASTVNYRILINGLPPFSFTYDCESGMAPHIKHLNQYEYFFKKILSVCLEPKNKDKQDKSNKKPQGILFFDRESHSSNKKIEKSIKKAGKKTT